MWQLAAHKDVNTEAENSTVLGAVTKQNRGKRRFNACCSELKSE